MIASRLVGWAMPAPTKVFIVRDTDWHRGINIEPVGQLRRTIRIAVEQVPDDEDL